MKDLKRISAAVTALMLFVSGPLSAIDPQLSIFNASVISGEVEATVPLAVENSDYVLEIAKTVKQYDSLKNVSQYSNAYSDGNISGGNLKPEYIGRENNKVIEVPVNMLVNAGVNTGTIKFDYDSELEFIGCLKDDKGSVVSIDAVMDYGIKTKKLLINNNHGQNCVQTGALATMLFMLPDDVKMDYEYKINFVENGFNFVAAVPFENVVSGIDGYAMVTSSSDPEEDPDYVLDIADVTKNYDSLKTVSQYGNAYSNDTIKPEYAGYENNKVIEVPVNILLNAGVNTATIKFDFDPDLKLLGCLTDEKGVIESIDAIMDLGIKTKKLLINNNHGKDCVQTGTLATLLFILPQDVKMDYKYNVSFVENGFNFVASKPFENVVNGIDGYAMVTKDTDITTTEATTTEITTGPVTPPVTTLSGSDTAVTTKSTDSTSAVTSVTTKPTDSTSDVTSVTTKPSTSSSSVTSVTTKSTAPTSSITQESTKTTSDITVTTKTTSGITVTTKTTSDTEVSNTTPPTSNTTVPSDSSVSNSTVPTSDTSGSNTTVPTSDTSVSNTTVPTSDSSVSNTTVPTSDSVIQTSKTTSESTTSSVSESTGPGSESTTSTVSESTAPGSESTTSSVSESTAPGSESTTSPVSESTAPGSESTTSPVSESTAPGSESTTSPVSESETSSTSEPPVTQPSETSPTVTTVSEIEIPIITSVSDLKDDRVDETDKIDVDTPVNIKCDDASAVEGMKLPAIPVRLKDFNTDSYFHEAILEFVMDDYFSISDIEVNSAIKTDATIYEIIGNKVYLYGINTKDLSPDAELFLLILDVKEGTPAKTYDVNINATVKRAVNYVVVDGVTKAVYKELSPVNGESSTITIKEKSIVSKSIVSGSVKMTDPDTKFYYSHSDKQIDLKGFKVTVDIVTKYDNGETVVEKDVDITSKVSLTDNAVPSKLYNSKSFKYAIDVAYTDAEIAPDGIIVGSFNVLIGQLGDITLDHIVDVVDSTIVLREAAKNVIGSSILNTVLDESKLNFEAGLIESVGGDTLVEFMKFLGNTFADGELDVVDSTLILRFSATLAVADAKGESVDVAAEWGKLLSK